MMHVYKELLKSNAKLVRRVVAGTEPPKDHPPIDWTEEFYDSYTEDWEELTKALYWLMLVVCIVSFAAGFLWGYLI